MINKFIRKFYLKNLISNLDKASKLLSKLSGGYSHHFLSAEDFNTALANKISDLKNDVNSNLHELWSWFAPTSVWDDFTLLDGNKLGNSIFNTINILREIKEKQILNILKSDPESAIMELDEIINELSDYGKNLSKLTDPQRILLFVENLEREINNGGFNQFYFNSSGEYVSETLDALKTINALQTFKIVQKANSKWDNGIVPSDTFKRRETLDKISDDADETWGQCDNEFYEYPDDITTLLFEYVKANKNEFV